MTSPLSSQVAGSHYKDMAIQPLEYCHANGIGKIEGDVIAYVSRWRKKNGIEDIKKAIHELEILVELEEGNIRVGQEEKVQAPTGEKILVACGTCAFMEGVRAKCGTCIHYSSWSPKKEPI